MKVAFSTHVHILTYLADSSPLLIQTPSLCSRRLLKDKIIGLKKELGGVRKHRDFQRRSRKKLGLPVIALVGYTNAGKSTLLNTLTRAGVMAENMLFATLDPTTRKVKLSGLKASCLPAQRCI